MVLIRSAERDRSMIALAPRRSSIENESCAWRSILRVWWTSRMPHLALIAMCLSMKRRSAASALELSSSCVA